MYVFGVFTFLCSGGGLNRCVVLTGIHQYDLYLTYSSLFSRVLKYMPTCINEVNFETVNCHHQLQLLLPLT